MTYLPRLIDDYLKRWAASSNRKPLLLRGARQVGKSCAVRNLGKNFTNYIEINFEKFPDYKTIFSQDFNVDRILEQITILTNQPITDGETLLFLDEIQDGSNAIMSLRYFKEDRPGLHVIAAGSLLEFSLAEIPTFGVGRIHSAYMYPMTFDEFLMANNETLLMETRNEATPERPLSDIIHKKLVEYFRTYLLVGGMPEVVSQWISSHDYIRCQEIQDDLITGYETDFAKYRKNVDPQLLKQVLRSVALQLNKKFTYSDVSGNYKTYDVKRALNLLELAGLITKVYRSDANGVPLGSETDEGYCKILSLDSGLTLRMLGLATVDSTNLKQFILTSSPTDLVNKGALAELIAGLEMIRYQTPRLRHQIFYWTRKEKNSMAEVDYVISPDSRLLPVEIKSPTRGGMKSLWLFMGLKHLDDALRCSLENFGSFEYIDKNDENAVRYVNILPLYAMSQLWRISQPKN